MSLTKKQLNKLTNTDLSKSNDNRLITKLQNDLSNLQEKANYDLKEGILPMENNVIIYRDSNIDSLTATALLHLEYPGAEYKKVNYNQFSPPSTTKPDKVFVVGINLPDENKMFLEKYCKNVYYMEQDNINSASKKALAYLCSIKEEYLSINEKFINMILANQIGDKERSYLKEFILSFIPELDELKDLNSANWTKYFYEPNTVTEKINEGVILKRYQSHIDKYIANRFIRSISFEGLKCLIANTSANFDIFEYIDNYKEYDLLIIWSMNKSARINFKLYSDKVDVREIAKKYGGGGPTSNIAGFSSNEIPKEMGFSLISI